MVAEAGCSCGGLIKWDGVVAVVLHCDLGNVRADTNPEFAEPVVHPSALKSSCRQWECSAEGWPRERLSCGLGLGMAVESVVKWQSNS
jgi:hypothetical protein